MELIKRLLNLTINEDNNMDYKTSMKAQGYDKLEKLNDVLLNDNENLKKAFYVLLEENKKLLDFKNEIKDSIERNIARDLNDEGVLMAVEKITFDRRLAEDDKIEDGHISLQDWREKQNKLFGKYKTK